MAATFLRSKGTKIGFEPTDLKLERSRSTNLRVPGPENQSKINKNILNNNNNNNNLRELVTSTTVILAPGACGQGVRKRSQVPTSASSSSSASSAR